MDHLIITPEQIGIPKEHIVKTPNFMFKDDAGNDHQLVCRSDRVKYVRTSSGSYDSLSDTEKAVWNGILRNYIAEDIAWREALGNGKKLYWFVYNIVEYYEPPNEGRNEYYWYIVRIGRKYI